VPTDYKTGVDERSPAVPESVAPMRHAVVDFAACNGASDWELEGIALAVCEALTNVVVHAYVGRAAPGVLTVQAWMHGECLHVVVGDEGIGMRRRTDSPGLGHGLPVIYRIAEDVEIDYRGSGVRLRMTFAIA
jgi:anti-sigma regulatory factor (Ser/Thr protein kinase)